MCLINGEGSNYRKKWSKKPNESELSVFRLFPEKLVSLQKGLDKKYQAEIFLVDQFLTTVDVP